MSDILFGEFGTGLSSDSGFDTGLNDNYYSCKSGHCVHQAR